MPEPLYEILEGPDNHVYGTYDSYAAALNDLSKFERQLHITQHYTTPIVNGSFIYWPKVGTNGIQVSIEPIEV